MQETTVATPQWVTPRVLAAHLGLAEKSVQRYRDRGLFPEGSCLRVGQTVRYDLARIVAHLSK